MKKIKQERRLLVAVRTKDIPRLTTKTVERTRKRLCEERLNLYWPALQKTTWRVVAPMTP